MDALVRKACGAGLTLFGNALIILGSTAFLLTQIEEIPRTRDEEMWYKVVPMHRDFYRLLHGVYPAYGGIRNDKRLHRFHDSLDRYFKRSLL